MGGDSGELFIALSMVMLMTVGIIWLVVWLIRRSFANMDMQLSTWARNLGVKYNKPESKWGFFWGQYPTLEGEVKGIPFYGYMYTKGSGKSQVTYTAFTLTLNGKNLTGKTLTVYKEGIFSKIGKALGVQDIELGNEDFDKNYIIKSNDEFFAKKILNLRVRQLLLRKMPNMAGTLTLDGNKLNYDVILTLVNDRNREAMEDAVATFIELAKEVNEN